MMSTELRLVARVTATQLPACRVCCSCHHSWESYMMKMMMCLGPIEGSPIKMWVERVCVRACVCVWVGPCKCVSETRQESTQWAALLQNNDLNQVQVLSTTQVFSPKPLQIVFTDKRTSCSLSLWNLKQRKKKMNKKTTGLHYCASFCFSGDSTKYLPAFEAQHFLCDVVNRITNTSLCHVFQSIAQELKKKQKTIKPPWFDNSSLFSEA